MMLLMIVAKLKNILGYLEIGLTRATISGTHLSTHQL